MQKTLLLIFFIILDSFTPCKLFAHKVNIYAFVVKDTVNVEGYFADGSKCKNCKVEVYDKLSNKLLLSGNTDENGFFSFKKPAGDITHIKVVLKAGGGHQASYELTLKESPKTKKEPKAFSGSQERSISKSLDGYAFQDKRCLTQEELEIIINQSIDKNMHALTEQIALLHGKIERKGMIEILGGIGYIIGILTIIMYLKSRKSKN